MKKFARWGALGSLALALVAGGVSGCAHQYGEYRSDKAIAKDVRTALDSSPYRYPGVTVSSYNHGVVQLNGYVATPQQRIEAEQLTQAVPGVREIVDNMVVTAPTGRPPIIVTPPYP